MRYASTCSHDLTAKKRSTSLEKLVEGGYVQNECNHFTRVIEAKPQMWKEENRCQGAKTSPLLCVAELSTQPLCYKTGPRKTSGFDLTACFKVKPMAA